MMGDVGEVIEGRVSLVKAPDFNEKKKEKKRKKPFQVITTISHGTKGDEDGGEDGLAREVPRRYNNQEANSP